MKRDDVFEDSVAGNTLTAKQEISPTSTLAERRLRPVMTEQIADGQHGLLWDDFRECSLDRLFRLPMALGRNIEIVIRKSHAGIGVKFRMTPFGVR